MCNTDYTQYVHTNIGTIGHLLSAAAPNVQSPHGCAVISPVGRTGMKDLYNSDKIFGFSVGCSVVMPCTEPMPDYLTTASHFDHDFELDRPDVYEVLLEDSDIRERHTAHRNYGAFEFSYPDAQRAYVVLYVDECTDYEFSGGCLSFKGRCKHLGDAHLYMMFDTREAVSVKRFTSKMPDTDAPDGFIEVTAILIQYNRSNVFLPFVISAADRESLDECFHADVEGLTFEDIHRKCKTAWNDVLGRIRIQGGSEAQKSVFYTALCRALSRMHNYSICGKYRGFDGHIHKNNGHEYYCDDGIWDTFRGMHPLQLILEPSIHRDILESYLRMYRQSGWLPRFPYPDGNIPCMLGHHTVSIFAESMAKGVDFDLPLAYEAAFKNATRRTMLPWRDGEAEELTKCYYEKGFFPALEEDEEETCPNVEEFENRQAVAVTIEHSYDDWCLAQIARRLGKSEDCEYFMKRSENYKNVYDPQIGFVHPRKANGSFTEKYNPKFCGGIGGRRYFAENNAYTYTFAVQHDVPGLIGLMGGKDAFAKKLDNLFIEQYDGKLKSDFLGQYPDATGLMGQFCMGNEPSFHIPYLYNYCGQAYKTQRKIHELIDLWFTDSPLGICGDEDGGAMSAFLVFSAIGFYPVNPASAEYDLGSPIFDSIEMDLPNGKTFTIRAEGASHKAKYIQSASINGIPLTSPKFSHDQMMEGGELLLIMGERPNKTLFA